MKPGDLLENPQYVGEFLQEHCIYEEGIEAVQNGYLLADIESIAGKLWDTPLGEFAWKEILKECPGFTERRLKEKKKKITRYVREDENFTGKRSHTGLNKS